jgi:hypothetical protein
MQQVSMSMDRRTQALGSCYKGCDPKHKPTLHVCVGAARGIQDCSLVSSSMRVKPCQGASMTRPRPSHWPVGLSGSCVCDLMAWPRLRRTRASGVLERRNVQLRNDQSSRGCEQTTSMTPTRYARHEGRLTSNGGLQRCGRAATDSLSTKLSGTAIGVPKTRGKPILFRKKTKHKRIHKPKTRSK